MIRVGILGATGYTAAELIKRLLKHPEAEISILTSRQEDNPHIASIHPQLTGQIDLTLENAGPETVAQRADCVFSCLPHAASAASVMRLVEMGLKVVDFSADYRFDDAEVYENWYGSPHPDAGRLEHVPYGLPELFAEQIAGASLVANPGCFPTGAILALAPLLLEGLIGEEGLIIDAKTGVSGAGRTPKLTTHFPECNESVSAYNVGRHRHMPEIDHVLTKTLGRPVETIFTPHLAPMDRGILTTAYAVAAEQVSEQRLLACLKEFYAQAPFVHVVDHLPATKDTLGSNACHVTARLVRGRAIVISSIDNLVKGASGAAVQNFNWMFGFPETMSF